MICIVIITWDLGDEQKGRLLSDSDVFMCLIDKESTVLVSFTLTQTRLIWEEGTSNEELHLSAYHMGMPVGIVLINDWPRNAQVTVNAANFGQAVLGYIKKKVMLRLGGGGVRL